MIDRFKLRAMDYVGNAHYGVSLPFNYLSMDEWTVLFEDNNLYPELFMRDIHLY